MHLYFVTRGVPKYTRRFSEEVRKKYFDFKNKITGKQIGAIQVGLREVKTWELVFPETEKKNIKPFIMEQLSKKDGGSGHVGIHFIKFKKDKFIDGVEQL